MAARAAAGGVSVVVPVYRSELSLAPLVTRVLRDALTRSTPTTRSSS